MAILGAHMSIAGGYDRAVERAHAAGCDCVQLFTKNNNQWRAKPISDDERHRFRSALKELNISHPISHASYLINLASPDPQLREKSMEAMRVELQRADLLGIRYVVVHPGSFTTGSEEQGLADVARSIDTIYDQHPEIKADILLETTAGQGSNLGWRFEQLRAIVSQSRYKRRIGVCVDTCHMFAAGYDLSDPQAYRQTIDRLIRAVGIRRIKAIHLNDSRQPLGSRKDRHAHIGRGEMGLEPFRNLLNDSRLAKVPMYLETPKGTEEGRDLDTINLATLRGLIASAN